MQNPSDFTLFSESAIGSPFAFSTAIKSATTDKHRPDHSPCDSNWLSLGRSSDTDSPRIQGLPSVKERDENGDVTNTSLESPTANDSTVGILDLDSIQSDSSTDGPFLTSPLAATGLHQANIISDGKLLAPSVPINNSSLREGLPSVLLQTVSAATVSRVSGSDSEGDTVLSAMASALAVYRNSSSSGGGVVSSPILLESSLDGGTSVGKTTLQPTADNISQGFAAHGEEEEEDGVMGVGGQSKALGVNKTHVSDPSSAAVLVVAGVGEQPAANVCCTEAVAVGVTTALPSVGGGVGDIPSRYSLGDAPGHYFSGSGDSMEGLPSTYLHQQDSTYPCDLTDFSSSLSLSHSHLDPLGPATGMNSVSSSPANNVSEFADGLGMGGARQRDGDAGDVYNPFELDDGSADGLGKFVFEELEPGCFADQLEKDEQELSHFHQSYALSTQGVSFDLCSPNLSGSRFADTSGEASISTYFQKKSHSLGQPFSGKLPPEDRPQFSDSFGHVIESPESLNRTITGFGEEGENKPMQDNVTPLLDTTLVTGKEETGERGSESATIKSGHRAEHVQSRKTDKASVGDNQSATHHNEYIHKTPIPIMSKYDIPKFILQDTYSFSSTVDPTFTSPAAISSTLAGVNTSIVADLSRACASCDPLLSGSSTASSSAMLLLHGDKLTPSLCKMAPTTGWDPLPSALAKPSLSTSAVTASSTEKSLQAHPLPPQPSWNCLHSEPDTVQRPGTGNPRTLRSSPAKPAGVPPGVSRSGLMAPTVGWLEELKPPIPSSAAPVVGLQRESSEEEMRAEMMQKLLKLQEDIELVTASANLLITKSPWKSAPSPLPQSTSGLSTSANLIMANTKSLCKSVESPSPPQSTSGLSTSANLIMANTKSLCKSVESPSPPQSTSGLSTSANLIMANTKSLCKSVTSPSPPQSTSGLSTSANLIMANTKSLCKSVSSPSPPQTSGIFAKGREAFGVDSTMACTTDVLMKSDHVSMTSTSPAFTSSLLFHHQAPPNCEPSVHKHAQILSFATSTPLDRTHDHTPSSSSHNSSSSPPCGSSTSVTSLPVPSDSSPPCGSSTSVTSLPVPSDNSQPCGSSTSVTSLPVPSDSSPPCGSSTSVTSLPVPSDSSPPCGRSTSVTSLPVPSDSLEPTSSDPLHQVIFSPPKLCAPRTVPGQASLADTKPLDSIPFTFTPTSFLPSSLSPLSPSLHATLTSSPSPLLIPALSPSPRTSSSLPCHSIGSTNTKIVFPSAPSVLLPDGVSPPPVHSPLQMAVESLITERLASLVGVKMGHRCLGASSDAAVRADAVCSTLVVGGACEVGENVSSGDEWAGLQARLRDRTGLVQQSGCIAGAQKPVTLGACLESNASCDNHVNTIPRHSLALDHMTSDSSLSSSFCRHVPSAGISQPSPLADHVITSHSYHLPAKGHMTIHPSCIPLTTNHMTIGTTSISSSSSVHMTAHLKQLYSSTCHVETSSAHLMYTSPPLCPTLTTSLTLPDHTPNPISAPAISVMDTHQFTDVCCVGVSTTDYVQVTNPGERWLQVRFDITGTHMDGQELSRDAAVFVFPETSYLEPNSTRLIKVTFNPVLPGSYESEVCIYASLMVDTGHAQNMPAASIALRAEAQPLQLELRPKHTHNTSSVTSHNTLDYGVLVGGATVRRSLELINKSQTELALEVTINNDSLGSAKYFRFHSLPPSLLPSPPFPTNTLSFTLPATPSESAVIPAHSMEISFTAPHQHSNSDVSQPQEVSAKLEVKLVGSHSKSGTLKTMSLKATVGHARLCVPRSLEAVSLSCTVGQAVTRTVPICNIGNIPVTVLLGVGGTDHAYFTVHPASLLLEPNEEHQVTVRFDSPTSPLIVEGLMKLHIEPGGPSFEVKLRGTAVSPTPIAEGVLSCSRRYLYWGGVALGGAKQLDLLLHNSFPTAVPLRLSVRHPLAPFQLDQDEVILLPQEEVPVKINFLPFSTSISVTALDVFDQLHARRFRIPLCGYGGISRLEVGGVRFTPNGGHRLDISKVQHTRGKKIKILLYNSGSRAAFMHAECHELEGHVPLPDYRAHIIPPSLVIPANSTGEIQLFYRLSKVEEDESSVTQTSLAKLVIQSGDECLRQKLVHAVKEEAKLSTANKIFVKDFPNQREEAPEMEWSAFHVDDIESVFSSQLTLTSITLIVSPEPMRHKSPVKASSDSSQHLVTPGHPLLPLSPSYTPIEKQVKIQSQSAAPDSLCTIQEDSALSLSERQDVCVMSHGDLEKNKHVAKWLSQTKRDIARRQSAPNRAGGKPPSQKKMVYLSSGFIQFSDTEVGSCSTLKIRVCNRDSVDHTMEVLKPANPFAISHQSFTLGSRMCARLPVHFAPKYAGGFEGILALRTHAGHQSFAQLKGRAVLKNCT